MAEQEEGWERIVREEVEREMRQDDGPGAVDGKAARGATLREAMLGATTLESAMHGAITRSDNDNEEEEGTWTTEIERAMEAADRRIKREDYKRAKLAERMWEVVVRERTLAERERDERRRVKAEERHRRRQEGDGTGSESISPLSEL